MFNKSDWLLVAGVGSCAIGGWFVYCYRTTNQFLNVLKGVEEHGVDDQLYEKVVCAGGTLSYVAVKGNISADDKVIHSAYNKEEGVIRMMKINEHKTKWDNTMSTWNDSKKTISTQWKEEPFSLVCRDLDKSAEHADARIHVKNPGSAYKLHLTTNADNYEPVTRNIGEHVWDFVKGEHVKGIQTVEKMLLTNAERTIIGELKLTRDNKLVINPPRDSSIRYYISNGMKDIIDGEKEAMNGWKILSIIFFLIGGGFTAFWLYKCYCKYREEKKLIKLQKEMEEYNESVDCDDDRICSICVTLPRDVVFLPCGHVCTCSQCGSQLDKCPVCRALIETKSAVFFS